MANKKSASMRIAGLDLGSPKDKELATEIAEEVSKASEVILLNGVRINDPLDVWESDLRPYRRSRSAIRLFDRVTVDGVRDDKCVAMDRDAGLVLRLSELHHSGATTYELRFGVVALESANPKTRA